MNIRPDTVIAPWAQFAAPLAATLASDGLPDDAVPSRREEGAWTLVREGRDILVRRWTAPGWLGRMAGKRDGNVALVSYRNALGLRNRGFNTAEPLAAVHCCHGLLRGECWYVCQHLAGFRDLTSIDRYTDDEPLLAFQLGAMLARMHRAGIDMPGLEGRHVLRRMDERGNYEIYIGNTSRVNFDVAEMPDAAGLLAALSPTEGFLRRLARSYAWHRNKGVDAQRLDSHARFLVARALREPNLPMDGEECFD